MARQNSPPSRSRCASVAGSTGGFWAGGAGTSADVTTLASSILGAIVPLIVAPYHADEQRVPGTRAKRGAETAAPVRRAGDPDAVRRLARKAKHRDLVPFRQNVGVDQPAPLGQHERGLPAGAMQHDVAPLLDRPEARVIPHDRGPPQDAPRRVR